MRVELVVATPDADLLVVNAARASFGKESKMEVSVSDDIDGAERLALETKGSIDHAWIYSDRWMGGYPVVHLSAKDAKLINYLAREKHVLPFRHPHITLRCSAPIFVARQLMKHQVGMSWSEESRRYIDSEPEFFWPEAWRGRAENVKQGSTDEDLSDKYIEGGAYTVLEATVGAVAQAYRAYTELLDNGVAPELARMILPQNMMTTWVWTGSLLSWHHMLSLRLDAHTQKETRDFAQMVKEIIVPLAPVSMAALMEEVSQ